MKIDLHTHSIASHDGGISAEQYKNSLHNGQLDYIAITDHNRIDFATRLNDELGEQIIVGEEIMTTAGEVIGLYLKKPVLAGLSLRQAVDEIKKQDGLVYIPHPFENARKGLQSEALEQILDDIDIFEVCNGRAFLQNRGQQAVVWARLNRVATAASSDAHGSRGLGKTATLIDEPPARDNLVQVLGRGTLLTDRPGIRSLLYPKYHRLRKKIGRTE
ncbi:MAG: PHP-associated domain-containing protein [Candidatus Saccharibacteria bacterium]|nr:PHP-associated domain-containing protein [Candidatus Saccharibacteria bacterium]